MFGKVVLKMFAGKKKYQHFFESVGNISQLVRYVGYFSKNEQYKCEDESYYLNTVFASAVKEPVIFDVGANIGDYSGAIDIKAKKFNKSFKLYSFEPAKKTFEILNHRFQGHPSITCVNYALSDQEGTATLYSDSENSDLASVYNLQNAYRQFDERFKETIQLTTVDAFMKKNSIDTIDYLKIDAEGHDFNVIKGGMNALNNKKIKAIQFEFGPPNIDSKVFFRDFWNLLSKDYDMYRLIMKDLYPVKKYVPQLEVFLTTNFLAILKK